MEDKVEREYARILIKADSHQWTIAEYAKNIVYNKLGQILYNFKKDCIGYCEKCEKKCQGRFSARISLDKKQRTLQVAIFLVYPKGSGALEKAKKGLLKSEKIVSIDETKIAEKPFDKMHVPKEHRDSFSPG